MSTETTLFAYITPKFTERIEDVAVEALGHILSQSEAARSALEETLREGGTAISSIARVQTQVIGDEGERPDLVGFDEEGVKQVLIEAKFWAGLTQNQPNQYLRQLPRDRPAALLFVAPAKRMKMLWPKLRQRATEKFDLAEESESLKLRSVAVNDGKRRLLLTSWALLLYRMETRAKYAGDAAAEKDIQQLRGLTDRMDANAFLPWHQNDLDMGPEFARRMLGLITLVDDATESGIAEKFLGISRRISLRWEGYGRNIRIGGVQAWFGFILDGWAQNGSTPLWLLFTYDKHEQLQEAGLIDTKVVQWRTKDGKSCIPIEFPVSVEYDAVLDSVVNSLKSVAKQLELSDPSTPQGEKRED